MRGDAHSFFLPLSPFSAFLTIFWGQIKRRKHKPGTDGGNDREEMFMRKREATCQFIIPIYSIFYARRAISFALFVFIAKDQPRFLLDNAY